MLASLENTASREVEVFDFRTTAQVATEDELRALGLDWRVLPPPASWLPRAAWAALKRGVISARELGARW